MESADALNAALAAELLFADTETVLLLVRQAAIPGTKLGKQWVFLKQDVFRFFTVANSAGQ